MKKKTLLIIAIILLIAIPFAVNFILKISPKKMADGTYYAVDCQEYPDAYAVVNGEIIQFYNIDLNAIYQKDQLNRLYKGNDNENLPFKYEKGWKDGTFVYYYRCIDDKYWFGLGLLYNS